MRKALPQTLKWLAVINTPMKAQHWTLKLEAEASRRNQKQKETHGKWYPETRKIVYIELKMYLCFNYVVENRISFCKLL